MDLVVSKSLNDLLVLGDLRGGVDLGLDCELVQLLLRLVIGGSLDLSLGLKLGNNILVLPSDLVGQTSD